MCALHKSRMITNEDNIDPENTRNARVADSDDSVTIDNQPLEGEGAGTFWLSKLDEPSLPETYRSVPVDGPNAPFWRRLTNYTALGFVIGVGYMDPGNWATDVAAGAEFAYDLMFVILLSSMAAMVLQHLSLKLGVATGRDLAQACRDSFPWQISLMLWGIFEIAMIATDMAEILGAAIALYLLTGLPLPAGVAIMALDVFFVLFLNRIRAAEFIVVVCTGTILICLSIVVTWSKPDWLEVLRGIAFTKSAEVVQTPKELFLAVGILGATVMPHNLFLHSSLVQTRQYPRTIEGKKSAIKFATIDVVLSLIIAFFINSFILIIAAAALHKDYSDTGDIFDAFRALNLAISPVAGTLFAVALLASGQQASITGTMAGQIVMEGFMRFKITPWKRRIGTRLIALVPTIVITAILNEDSVRLLIISQVILSLTLSFATFPLVWFTSDVRKMGPNFVNGLCLKITSTIIVLVIAGFNLYLLATPSTWSYI